MQKLARHWSKRFGKKTFDYLHDFGDSWDHRIKVEKRLPAITGLNRP
ncbi:IS1096 element passenger TnpR family protein [Pseudomonas sp.]